MVVLGPYQKTLGICSEEELVERFLSSLAITNRTHGFFVDWRKVNANVQELKTEIALLGCLAGSTNPEEDLRALLMRYPEVSKAIPILIAIRDLKLTVLEDLEASETYAEYDFSKAKLSSAEIDRIVRFCSKTGITSILTSLQGLRDYVTGVEVGTDTNARKNRSGNSMERLVNASLDELSEKPQNMKVRTQQKFSRLEKSENITVPLSLRDRKFDIAILLDNDRFNVETNFYSGTGSKPQEIVDSYIYRHQELNEAGWKFIWVTDGHG